MDDVQMPDQPYTLEAYSETHFNQISKKKTLNTIRRRPDIPWAYSKV